MAVDGMDGTQPAALFDRGDQTVMAALLVQLGELVPDAFIEVLAPEWAADSIRGQIPPGVAITACRTIRIALNEVIRHAYEGIARGEEVAIVDGGLVAHGEALAAVLADPAPVHSSLLVGERAHGPGIRTAEDIVVSGGSSAHSVTDPDRDSLGVLRILKPDLAALAEAARGISATGRVSDTAGDLIDLLIVGLVRLGTRLDAVPVGPYVLYRPQTQLEVGAALVDLKEIDEDRLRLAATARADDGLYAGLVRRWLSRPVTRWALQRGLARFWIASAAVAAAVLAAVTFATGTRGGLIAGAVLLQAAFVFSCSNGELARYTRTASPFGGWLETVSERINEYVIYAGLALGALRSDDTVWTLAATMLAVQAYRQMVDAGFAERRAEWQAEEAPEPVTLPLNQRDDGGGAAGRAIGRPHETRRPVTNAAIAPAPAATPNAQASAAVQWLEHTDGHPALVWIRRSLAVPVGERWLVISVAAALYGPREAFVAVLAATGFGVIYMTVGRMLRSMAHA